MLHTRKPIRIYPMEEITVSDLTQRAVAAKQIEDPTARRIELRAIFGAATECRLAAIEQHLSIAHEGMQELRQTLRELNESFGKPH